MPLTIRSVVVAGLLGLLMPVPAALAAQPRVEVAFVLDTTGSMEGLIDGAKRKIWSIASSIVDTNPDAEIRMALVAYRDRGDDYVTQVSPMTADIQDLYGDLIRLRAQGGGDTPESVNEALHKAIHNLGWTPGQDTKRIVFLVGDAPPHMDYDNAPKYPEVLAAAREKGIVVNAVQAGDAGDTRQIWQDIAQRGNGSYIPIPQDGGRVVVIETPYDDDILGLQRELDETVLPYGPAVQQSRLREKVDTRAAAPAAVRVDNSSFYSKRGSVKEVVTGGGDLTTDVTTRNVTVEALPEADLPQILRDKKPEERKAYVERQTVKRRALQERMAGLVGKRDAFIAAQAGKVAAAGKDSFDRVVQETLRKQLK